MEEDAGGVVRQSHLPAGQITSLAAELAQDLTSGWLQAEALKGMGLAGEGLGHYLFHRHKGQNLWLARAWDRAKGYFLEVTQLFLHNST